MPRFRPCSALFAWVLVAACGGSAESHAAKLQQAQMSWEASAQLTTLWERGALPQVYVLASEIRFEDLIGKTVRNTYGRPIGIIEDARIEPDGDEYLVSHFLLVPVERIPRIKAFLGELPTFLALGIGAARDLRPLPWQWFDLSDPDHPRLIMPYEGGD